MFAPRVSALFDTSGFPARWYCGDWPAWLGWEHIGSDSGIAAIYLFVAVLLASFGRMIGMHILTVCTSVAFFTLCGLGHAVEAVIFWHPVYYFAGHNKALQLVSAILFLVSLAKNEVGLWRTPKQVRDDRAESQAIFDMSSVATYVVDQRGCLTKINRAMTQLTGWNDDQLGKNMHYVLHHHDQDGNVYPIEKCRMFQALTEQRTIREQQDAIWDRDGNMIECSWVSTPVIVKKRAIRTQIQVFPKHHKTLAEHAALLRGE